jgi:hypothetical protein
LETEAGEDAIEFALASGVFSFHCGNGFWVVARLG